METEKPDWVTDTTAGDQWQVASLNGPIIQQLEKAVNIMGHMVEVYAKESEKQIKQMRKL